MYTYHHYKIVCTLWLFLKKNFTHPNLSGIPDANRDILGEKLTSDHSLFSFYENQQAATSTQDFKVVSQGCPGL